MVLYVRSFTGIVQSFMFLRRKPIVLLACPLCSEHETPMIGHPWWLLLSICLSRQLLTCDRGACSTFFFFGEILNTTHLVGLKLICQVVSNALMQKSLVEEGLCHCHSWLLWTEDSILVEMLHNIALNNVFEQFTRDGSETYRTVIWWLVLVPFLEDGHH